MPASRTPTPSILRPIVIALAVLASAPRSGLAEPWDPLLERMRAPGPQVTVFLHVNVIPMDSARVVRDQTVIVRDGRIESLGSKMAAPKGARRIDGRGKYLIPGLIDMHFHMPGAGPDSVNLDPYLVFFVANGVTTVRSTVGAPMHPRTRDDVRAGRRFGPTLYVATRPLISGEVKSPEQAREMVHRYRAEGFDLIKLYGIKDTTVYNAAVEAARQEKMIYFGHVSDEVGIEGALRARQGIEHLDGYLTPERQAAPDLPRLARETRKAGIWNCPTQFFHEVVYTRDLAWLRAREGVALVPDSVRIEWETRKKADIEKFAENRGADWLELLARRRIIRALDEGGAGIVLGADTPGRFRLPGFAVMEEARALHDAGLTPAEVLAAATRNAAAALGAAADFGTIAAGKRADLVLLDGNPLQDLGNLRRRTGVMLRGVWFPAAELASAARACAKKLTPSP